MKIQILSIFCALTLAACGGDDKASAPAPAENKMEDAAAAIETEVEAVVEQMEEPTSIIDGEVVKTPEAIVEESEGMMDEAMDAAKEYVAENQDEMMDKAKEMMEEKAMEMTGEDSMEAAKEKAMEEAKNMLKDNM